MGLSFVHNVRVTKYTPIGGSCSTFPCIIV